MAPTSRPTLSNHSSHSKPKPTLEILPDTRFIVFHGGEHEAQPVRLTGRVRLTTPEAMGIVKPKIRLEGRRKIRWYHIGPVSHSIVEDKRVFWHQEQRLGGVETPHKINAGTIEWPFEFELAPAMPESVEGLRETHIVYHLHASVARPGWSAKDLLAQEHIRIVRTLGPESMETTRSRVNADVWANKVSYSISIPSDAIVFGTSITADVELSPLKKGLRLGKIELKLQETIVRRIQAAELPDARSDRSNTEELEVAKSEMDFPESAKITYDDETVDNPTMADEMYKFKATLSLPKSLNACRQDVDLHQINVTHRFKLMVNIHNPEGHTSQLVCRLPVKLFISPNLPVDESNHVQPGIAPVSDDELNDHETRTAAPPEYGRHQLDQMYNDIDPSGYLTRAGSGPATPAGGMAQSRRGSRENVLSLNGVANVDLPTAIAAADASHHGSAVPQLLHSRLTDLQDTELGRRPRVEFSPSGGNSPAGHDHSPGPRTGTLSAGARGPYPGTHTGGSNSGAASAGRSSNDPSSRRSSAEETAGDPRQYNMDSLSRVPSYGAALRSDLGAITPASEVPPSYIEAISRPPSPLFGGAAGGTAKNASPSSSSLTSSTATIVNPAVAAAAAAASSTTTTGANAIGADAAASSSTSRTPPRGFPSLAHPTAILPTRPHNHAQEEQARLRTLRAGV